MTICLILAAGSASRMQQPKMLLPFRSTTLLQHLLDTTGSLTDSKRLVVTGSYHQLLAPILEAQQVELVYNEDWAKGMGHSIGCGVQYVLQHYPAANRLQILVCDQPYITRELLQSMQLAMNQTGKQIVACGYAGTIGTPVLFAKNFFERLLSLSGDKGARQLIRQYPEDLHEVDFPEGAIDIDRPEDLHLLNLTDLPE